MKLANKVKTGIRGFDKLVLGGFPRGKAVLLSGTPGTGKTIFALEYLHNGAKLYNEKGLYVTFEEEARNLRSQAAQFGWTLEKLEKAGKLKIWSIPTREIKETTAKEIISYIKKCGIHRLVIDSLSALSINSPTTFTKITELTEISIKHFMYYFVNEIRALKEVTSLLISQTTDSQLSRDTVSEFICDGIVLLTYEAMGGESSRSLMVRKMRETKNNEDIHSLIIDNKGIKVYEMK